MSKRIKELLVTDLQQRIGDTSEMLVVDSSRLDAISDNRFRLGLREKDIRILTVKNSMALRALHSAEVTALDPILEGPSSLVFGGEDIVSLSKEVAGWARELGDGLLEIKGGMLEGITLSASDVDELSKSPSREELIGQIAGLLLSPGATIAGSLLGPGGLVAGSIEAIADGEAEEETEAETEEAAVEEADTGEEETGAAEEPKVASEEPEAAAEEPEAASEEPEAAAEADSDADGEGGQEPESEESEA